MDYDDEVLYCYEIQVYYGIMIFFMGQLAWNFLCSFY